MAGQTLLQWYKENKPEKVATCRLCGREGYFSSRPDFMSDKPIISLAHSCPVRNAKAKAKRDKKTQERIDRDLSIVVDMAAGRVTSGTSFAMSVMDLLFENDLYPEQVDDGDIFSPDTARGKKYHAAYNILHAKCVDFITEKRKYPTKTNLKKLLRLTLEEIEK